MVSMNWLESLPDFWWNDIKYPLLSPESVKQFNAEILFIVRCLILETRTYARTCKRLCLYGIDFQAALDARNIHQTKRISHKATKSNDSKICNTSVIEQTDRVLFERNSLKLSVHWLGIDGEVPIVYENSLPTFVEEDPIGTSEEKITSHTLLSSKCLIKHPVLEELYKIAGPKKSRNHEHQYYVQPLTKNNLIVKPMHCSHVASRHFQGNMPILSKSYLSETCLAHELSLEQQSYFKLITESCVSGTENQYCYALKCLSSDAALQPLVPRLLLFIAKGIETNIHVHDLNFIARFLSVYQMLVVNTFVAFDKYLHLIIPTLLSCILCMFDAMKNDCTLSTTDQSNSTIYSTIWIIREQSSDLIAYFTKRYGLIPYLTERIVSRIESTLATSGANSTFSIIYTCIRTLLLIDAAKFNLFVSGIYKDCSKDKILEVDFDLNYVEQQTCFNRKIDQLFNEYHVILEGVKN